MAKIKTAEQHNHPFVGHSALSKATGSENDLGSFFENYWNSNAVAKHRRGLTDMEWASRQKKGKPKFKIGDVVEFKEGGFGVISEVSEPHNGWPSKYATRSVPGMKPFSMSAWHYEGDFKRMVVKGALHNLPDNDSTTARRKSK